jgi:hypothetical protein
MSNPFRTHPYRTVGAVGALLAGLAWLAFGYFGLHTLFVDDVVSEAAPVFDGPSSITDPDLTSIPTVPSADTTARGPEEPTGSEIGSTPPSPVAPTEPAVRTELAGSFVADAHPTSGRAVVLGNGTGQRFLRFEHFATDNGPDLNVYLVNSSTGDVSDYVDLGDLKGNVGDQNYEIPAEIDLDVYDSVVIWCVRFGVGFGTASLMAA